jgi:hypothetical protein
MCKKEKQQDSLGQMRKNTEIAELNRTAVLDKIQYCRKKPDTACKQNVS